MHGGYREEAAGWRDWLLRAVAGDPSQIQIMYGIAGERQIPEIEAAWLPGYEGSAPVRVGNAAVEQFQLDVFGELMDALYVARRSGLEPEPAAWALQRHLMDHLETVWNEPDEGIWEVRGGRRRFTHSRVMAWVAFDRSIKAAEALGLEAPLERWKRVRQEIHDDVCANGYDPASGAFVQSYGSRALDASLLLIPLVGFLPPTDPRVLGTVRAIEDELMVDGYRPAVLDRGRQSRRAAARRRGVPAVHLLAGRRLRPGRTHRRRPAPVRAAAGDQERPRPALGGIRPGFPKAGRQLPAGVHARRAGEHGGQPDSLDHGDHRSPDRSSG